ncbi:hypothetical protein TNCV_24632 [Trichonephila clavipes]|uniref:C2H2-type domain-containing protein n=1 Tax=Trichonephila clavipes TaxID=2585209 RepID=A0A8X6W1G5_TRICX|nr:hypothetical protein TNCV_24632 [Trichonephila clavipes]
MNFTGLDLTSSDWEDSCIELPDQRMQYIYINLKSWSCSTCGKFFTTKGRLLTHIDIHNDVRKMYSCPHCVHTFTRADNLQRHIKGTHVS